VAELTNRIGGALDQIKALEKEIAALKGKLASARATSWPRRPSTSMA
jgi:alanyl-tRNA synthetase